jgi:hypothetical protein
MPNFHAQPSVHRGSRTVADQTDRHGPQAREIEATDPARHPIQPIPDGRRCSREWRPTCWNLEIERASSPPCPPGPDTSSPAQRAIPIADRARTDVDTDYPE